MNITQFAIDNNRTTLTLLFLLLITGLSAFKNMPRAYDPGFTIRTAQVTTYLPGASPARIEQLISDKVEEVAQEIPELDFVKSESRTGVSIVSVNIKESYTSMRPIWDSLRRKVEAIKNDLPAGVIGPVVNDEFGDVFGIVFSLTGEGFNYAEIKNIADDVRADLLKIQDVAKVDILGAQDERVYIEYNNTKLAELNLSPSQLKQMLTARNILNSGGAITINDERIGLEPTGNFETVSDIEDTIIQVPGSNKLIYLKDIVHISRDYIDPPSSKVSSSGTPGLALAISMREGGNNIQLGVAIKNKLDQLRTIYPIGIDFEIINFSPREVDEKVKAFTSNLVQAILVVSLVMLFSLGLRTGLVVATLIPSSMLIALLLMSYLDIGLDQISLAALIISLGMLVDNGIVMSENILTQMQEGKSRLEAAINSATELKVPLLIASLTTSAAFLPIFLAESSMGEFTSSLFKVVTITLICSWLLSITVIPLFCVMFLTIKVKKQDDNNMFLLRYRELLVILLRHRYITLISVAAIFFIAISLMRFIPNVFMPPSDRTYFKVELEMPQGTSITKTEAVVKEIERYMHNELLHNENNENGVTNWIAYIGSGGTRFILTHSPKPSSPNIALMVINVPDEKNIEVLMKSIEQFAFNNFPDLIIKLKKIENGAAIDNPVEIRLYGPEIKSLYKIVDELKAHMLDTNELRNISDDWGIRSKKLLVSIDQARALRAGVSSEDIAISLQSGLSGLELTEYREGSDIIPVMFRASSADRNDIGKLETLAVYSQSNGTSVPLMQVADIKIAWEPAKILRRDRLKTITVGAQLNDGFTAANGFDALQPWLDEQSKKWDTGYRYELGGEAESSAKAGESIMVKLPIAVIIILVLLIGQFNSIRKAGIVLITIPLGLIGVIISLLIANSTFGFMTLLGLISLAGIVINNAIVLLERIQIEITEFNREPMLAIIEAAQRRARPILLTTATTVLGLIPLYLGGGAMWEPLAITIMGGLIFSTLLTLGVVPVLYATLFQVKSEN